MNRLVLYSLFSISLLLSEAIHAQVSISFPTNRAVFQRDGGNQATFRITGYYTSAVDRIEARLVARNGQGTSTDWRIIQANPAGGVFAGDMSGIGGWYSLEVRGMKGDQQIGVSSVERVGIGEVFIIAGQSNAQGIHRNAPISVDDRVNAVNYNYPPDNFPNDPPTPQFVHLDNGSDFFLAPRGVGSWAWGRLGDILANRLNVPIMFFNTAFAGTAVRNWRQSAPEGGTAISIYNGDSYPGRQPYINLKLALQFYCNMLGARAVLWQQGEADNYAKTSTGEYVNDLTYLINQSRQDFGRNISWVIARVSYGDYLNTYQPVIDAQNQVIASVDKVFAGPATDGIQVPRSRPPLYDIDGLHFDYEGLGELANAWNNSLNDSFFQQATPTQAALSPTLSVACAGNQLTLSVNGDYTSFAWESGETGRSITKGSGLYRAKVKDARGNTFYTGYARISDMPVASVANNKPAAICIGSSLGLVSSYDHDVSWINQQSNQTISTDRQINVSEAGNYYIKYHDVSGCDFTSNTLNLTVNPLPATPTIEAQKPTTFCQGDNTVLSTSTGNVQYSWSDGQNTQAATFGQTGTYSVRVTDQNGCTSAESNAIRVTANPVPDKPTVQANGPTTFCADRTLTLTAPEATSYSWSSGETSRSIAIAQSGSFSVRVVNQYGCTSTASDAIGVTVNPLPAIPTVSAAGTTTFCDGGSVVLNSTSPFNIVWTTGQTDKSITITKGGNYAVQAKDGNGCLSPYSISIPVVVNPLPARPTILTSKSPIICEGDKVVLSINGPYTVFWSTGDSTSQLTTGTPGQYSAIVRDANSCLSPRSEATVVETRPLPPAPTINSIGTFTLEAVTTASGPLFRWKRNNDTLTAQTPIIKANQEGSYTAQSSTVYSSSLTCYSLPSTAFVFTVDPSLNGLAIYPNPAPDKVVTLETLQDLQNATIVVYSITGQQVYSATVPLLNERQQLSFPGLSAGVYIIRVQTSDYKASRRILLGL